MALQLIENTDPHPLRFQALPWQGPRWLEKAHDWTAERCRGAG